LWRERGYLRQAMSAPIRPNSAMASAKGELSILLLNPRDLLMDSAMRLYNFSPFSAKKNEPLGAFSSARNLGDQKCQE
jgi:hypothetical protein